VEITDNDEPGIEVQHTNGSTVISEDGATDTYQVRLKSVPANVVTVRTFPDEQLKASPQTVTFDSANWETWQTVTVTAVDDARVEGEHEGVISHVSDSIDPFYMGVKGDKLVAKINDNDIAGVQTDTTDGSVTVKEGNAGNCDFATVVLTAQPSNPVTVRIFPDDAPEVTVSPASGVVFTPDTWNQPLRFTICAIDDNEAEPPQILSLKVRTFSDDKFYNGATWPDLTVRVEDNDAAVITRHEPHDQREIIVTRNDRKAGLLSVRLFDAPTAPVRVYLVYGKQLTGDVDKMRKRKFLTFTKNNWSRKQFVRVYYKQNTGGRGSTLQTVRFRVQSKDRRYNGMRPRAIKVRILDNNRVGTRWRNGQQVGGANGRPRKSAAPLVAAPLPKTAPSTVFATLPQVAAATWDPRSLTNRVVDQPWAKYENGSTMKGGLVRITGLRKGSEQGFENIDHAAKLIRVTRKREGADWTRDTRMLVLQGSDHRFYVYEATLVLPTEQPRPVAQPLDGAIAVYVFGIDSASWRDDDPATTWRAHADTAIS
jgi:hypothetical protein